MAGLGGLNLLVLAAGATVLWALGAVRWWIDLVRLAGVAYLLGLASVMVALTLELVVGVPIGAVTGAVTLVGIGAAGLVLGWRRRVDVPARRRSTPLLPRITLLAALSVAGVVVYYAGMFRAARLSSTLGEWDGWWFWVPKAKAIYYSGDLDPELLGFLGNASYPPGLPAFHSLAFQAMGSPDDVTLHLQYWVYAVGFTAALAGLLATRVRQNILLPLLLPLLLTPSFVTRGTWTYADLPLGYLVAVAALLVLLWVHERQAWQLVVATVLLSGAAVTKREGLLLAACVVLAGLAASWASRRWAWPRLVGSGIVVLALALPWVIWRVTHELPSDLPSAGPLGGLDDGERALPTIRLVVTTLFDFEFWLLVPAVALIATVLALFVRYWSGAVYAVTFVCTAGVVAFWAILSVPTFPISQDDSVNPIVRLTGTSILVLAALTPLLLENAWRTASADDGRGRGAIGSALDWRSRSAWAIVLAAVLVYPASMVVGYSGKGLPGGLPTFPSAEGCRPAPVDGAEVRLVVGHVASYPAAQKLAKRARDAGAAPVEVAQDGCGGVRVSVDAIPTVAEAEVLADRLRPAGLDPTFERQES